MERAFDFTAVGEISLDTLVLGAGGDESSSKQRAQSIVDLPGGQAATAAVACRRLGWRSRWAGAFGDDEAGRRCIDALTDERVDAHTVTRGAVPSRRALIYVDPASGERKVFEARDPRLGITPGGIPNSIFTSTRILLVDATDPKHALHAARVARAAGVRTMIDVDYLWPGLDELLRAIDIVIMPASIAEKAAGVPGVGIALSRIGQATGALAVVATLGADGALGWTRDEEIRVPAVKVEAVDTTGAGDAFRAGFAASWLSRGSTKPNLADLLADANLVAGLSCRALGAQTALPRALEVPDHLRGPV
jgi:sulfofructose kinase